MAEKTAWIANSTACAEPASTIWTVTARPTRSRRCQCAPAASGQSSKSGGIPIGREGRPDKALVFRQGRDGSAVSVVQLDG